MTNRVAAVLRAELQPADHTLLLFIVEFFQHLMTLSQYNAMGAQNVAIVIGPLLMRPPDDAVPDIDEIQAGNNFIEWLMNASVAQLR